MATNYIISDEQIQELKEKISEHKKKPGPLMPTLHDAQRIFGCIPIPIQ
jgi:NADH:ubiquinone oxidoreductase subunit E